MTHLGECCCGGTVIEISGDPVLNTLCHCNNCKRRTGSGFSYSAYFPTENVRVIKDSTKAYELDSQFGKQSRHFCSNCGTTLFWHVEAFKGVIGVAGGCFAEDPLPFPTRTANDENRFGWIHFPESIMPLTPEDLPGA